MQCYIVVFNHIYGVFDNICRFGATYSITFSVSVNVSKCVKVPMIDYLIVLMKLRRVELTY